MLSNPASVNLLSVSVILIYVLTIGFVPCVSPLCGGSKMWVFSYNWIMTGPTFSLQIRAKAIQALDMYARTQNAALTVLLAKKYNVVYWLRNGYTRLVNEHLDRETKCKIYYAKSSRNRDYIKSINDSPYQCSSGYLHLVDESCPHFKIRPALFDEVFGDELKVMGRSTRELVLTHRSTFLSDIDHASHISNCSVFCNREPIHAKMVNRCGEKISVRPMR